VNLQAGVWTYGEALEPSIVSLERKLERERERNDEGSGRTTIQIPIHYLSQKPYGKGGTGGNQNREVLLIYLDLG
jgi:hypothetical protein